MKNKIIFIILGVLLSITLTSVANENRNPFEDIVSGSGGGLDAYPDGEAVEGAHPLQKYPFFALTIAILPLFEVINAINT